MPKLKEGTTWGDVYYRFLAQGYDNGYACFAADRWEESEKKKGAERAEKAIASVNGDERMSTDSNGEQS